MFLYEKLEKDTEGRNRVFNYYSCNNCRNEYKKQKRLAEGAAQEHYCSQKCYRDSTTRIKVTCAHCGTIFTKQPSKMNTKSGLHFCSREHKDLAQKYIKEIQPAHYGTTTKNYRDKALNHYGCRCSKCGFTNVAALEVHHIDRNRDNNDISNLVVLCANCHRIEHRGT